MYSQFNIVWCVWTFPFLPISKCRRKNTLCYSRCITVFKKRFHSKRLMPFWPTLHDDWRLYSAMCVSPRHLQRCRHGAKWISSNCFCPTLYERLQAR